MHINLFCTDLFYFCWIFATINKKLFQFKIGTPIRWYEINIDGFVCVILRTNSIADEKSRSNHIIVVLKVARYAVVRWSIGKFVGSSRNVEPQIWDVKCAKYSFHSKYIFFNAKVPSFTTDSVLVWEHAIVIEHNEASENKKQAYFGSWAPDGQPQGIAN